MKEQEPIKGLQGILIALAISVLLWAAIVFSCRALIDSRHNDRGLEIVEVETWGK